VDKAVNESFTATADGNGQIAVDFSSGARRLATGQWHPGPVGGTQVQAINAGLLPGGTIHDQRQHFQNQGTLTSATREKP